MVRLDRTTQYAHVDARQSRATNNRANETCIGTI
jgi:hypothetical protein